MNNNRLYRIGKKRRISFRLRRKTALMLLLVFIAVSFFVFNEILYSYASEIAEDSLKNKIGILLEKAVIKELSRDDIEYSELVHINYKADGGVASLETNTPKLLKLRGNIAADLFSNINANERTAVSVPIGNLSGIQLLSGKGPSVKMDLMVTHGMRVYMGSSFFEAGINQTLHRISVCFEADITVLTPAGKRMMPLMSSYTVAETVIVGEVPDAYTKINRLTDDISETEIDDIYDFGASTE